MKNRSGHRRRKRSRYPRNDPLGEFETANATDEEAEHDMFGIPLDMNDAHQ
jgi:hypothetical protein